MINIQSVPVAFGSDWGNSTQNLSQVVGWQIGTITQNSTSAVDLTFNIPTISNLTKVSIVDIIVDVTTAFDSAVSATLTVGNASGDTTYASGVNAKTAGRVRPTFTAAQCAALQGITGGTIVATVTPSGATTVGTLTVTLLLVTTSITGID